MICPICKKNIKDDAIYCEKCGSKIPRCPSCHRVIYDHAQFCVYDGMKIPDDIRVLLPEENSEKNEKPKKHIVIGTFIVVVMVLLIVVMSRYIISHFEKIDKENNVSPIKSESIYETETESETVEITESTETEEKMTESESNETESVESVSKGTVTVSIDDGKKNSIEKNNSKDTDVAKEDENHSVKNISMDYVTDIEASSALSEYGMTHTADRIADNDLSTGWVEGVEGQGEGESVTIYFDDVYTVSGFYICAGYHKSEDHYNNNSRPKQFSFEYADGTEARFNIDDVFSEKCIVLKTPKNTDSIKITIESVYPGDEFEDTAISEISFY